MATLTNFDKSDWRTFSGAEPFSDGSAPRIYHFTEKEIESFFLLMGMKYSGENMDAVYIIHGGVGMCLEWTQGNESFHVGWPAGDISARTEDLLHFLDSVTLPLWATSVATAKLEEY